MNRWLRLFGFDTLTSRTILLLLLGIGVVHLASLHSYRVALDREASVAGDARLADRLLTIKRAVMRVLPAEREAVAHELSGGPIEAHWSRNEHAVAGGPGSAEWEGLRDKIIELAPELAANQIVIGANRNLENDPHLALISLRLPDESWINVSVFSRLSPPVGSHGTVISTTLMALGVVLIAVLVVGWMTRPLRVFADAAQRLYRSADQAKVPEEGPREVRALASAFNEMQARIKRLIDDRTQALAAVSHDLRTPLTRLRLKAEKISDQKVAASMRADLAEMEAMLDQTLTYLSGGRLDEPTRPLDLAVLIETLADEAADAGAELSVRSLDVPTIVGRPLALRRAFGNLIGNALKYGVRARIALERREEEAVVIIDDDGPGIAEEDIARAFEPFQRIEQSRSKETGGFGLGLTIARAVILGHGGSLVLCNRAEGGLRATVTLPKKGTGLAPATL